ncbi:MAG: hypothetical protein ABI207_04930 [Crocinitomicaceae bacterium]
MKKTLILSIALIVFGFTSCNKITQNKLDGTWKMASAKRDGTDYTALVQIVWTNYTLILNKDGSYSETYANVKNAGAWNVTAKGTIINLNPNGNSARVYVITKFKKDILVVTTTNDGHNDEYTLIH